MLRDLSFETKDYYFATYSEAEWHTVAIEKAKKDGDEKYGTNYDPDLQRFGDIVAKGD